jgi:hypothetical protein
LVRKLNYLRCALIEVKIEAAESSWTRAIDSEQVVRSRVVRRAPA